MIVSNCPPQLIGNYAERVRIALGHESVGTEAGEIKISTSIGAACTKDSHCNQDCLLRAADAALYRAKERGRNRVELD